MREGRGNGTFRAEGDGEAPAENNGDGEASSTPPEERQVRTEIGWWSGKPQMPWLVLGEDFTPLRFRKDSERFRKPSDGRPGKILN